MNKREAWEYYKKWMKEKTYSPALKSDIIISKHAWNHVVHGNKKRRRKSKDKFMRLSLLKEVRYLLNKETKYSIDIREGQKYYIISKITTKKNSGLRIIIKDNSKGEKILFSWMKT